MHAAATRARATPVAVRYRVAPNARGCERWRARASLADAVERGERDEKAERASSRHREWRWLSPLLDARGVEGSALKCERDARPDVALGVRVVTPHWSSEDDDDDDDASSSSSSSSSSPSSSSSSGATSNARHPVIRALLQRKREGSRPGHRTDGMRIGLAVEGGGMRGVVSAAQCGELLRMGYWDCFDAAYGSSAGAMNLTYYLAKQPEGVAAYEEDLVSGEFLSLARLGSRANFRRRRERRGTRTFEENNPSSASAPPPAAHASASASGSFDDDDDDDDDDATYLRAASAPAMDISYLVDGVMDGITDRPLTWAAVLASEVPLKIVATSLDALSPVLLSPPFEDIDDLKRCLKASAWVPTLAGSEPVRHRGQRLVDAAVMEPIPIRAAASDGCTHVLVLCTRTLPPPSAPGSGSSSAATTTTRIRRLDELRSAAKDDGVDLMVSRLMKSLSRAAYFAVRRVLLTPPHMRTAWGVTDEHARITTERRGDSLGTLDAALVIARDDPDAARRMRLFGDGDDGGRGPEVFAIAPKDDLKETLPGSLCVDSDVLKVGNRVGVEAVFKLLSAAEAAAGEDAGSAAPRPSVAGRFP